MDSRNLLILFVYIVCVSYVIYRAINSLDKNQVEIRLDQEALNNDLETRNLKDLVSITVPLAARYKLEHLDKLSVNIANKSSESLIEVDWDRSSLTDFNRESRRVIRVMSTMTLNLYQPQIPSVINPGQTIHEKLTVENVLQTDASNTALKISAPLFNVSKADKKRYTDFMSRKASLLFTLSLALRVLEPTTDISRSSTHLVPCNFLVTKVPWTDALRWKAK